MNLKEILKNKILILLIVIIDIGATLLTIHKIGFIYGITVFFIVNIIIINLLLLVLFDISIINYKKIIKIIKYKTINKNLEEEDIYLKKLKIATFDNTGSLTHPSTLYFEEGFNGYKYWMVYTPYDDNNVELENPSIAVSNDGINWNAPKGLINPLLPIIKKQKPNTYYNDPFLFYTNKLEIWYRHTIEKNTLVDSIYRITSADGITWSQPELMIKDDGSHYISLSILKFDNVYYMYYFNLDYKLNVRTSKNLIDWSTERKVDVKDFKGKFWHGEVKLIDERAYLLFMDKEYNLYLATSNDLVNFNNCKKFISHYYSKYYLYSNVNLYKSSFLNIENEIYLYIPYRINKLKLFKINRVIHKKWELTLTKIGIEKLDKIFEKV